MTRRGSSRNPLDVPESVIAPERVFRWKQNRFNPIRGLTPEVLARQLDEFRGGFLRAFALTMDSIARRDDVLRTVIPKRKAAISNCELEIIQDPRADVATAAQHADALRAFYDGVEVTDALDMNKRRGVSLLIEQMMEAVGTFYSVHEILWRPSAEGLTARFNRVPLWFFENTTGRLRFLKDDYAIYGEEMDATGWMVTVADGLMEACAVAYMYKHIPMKDWLTYCEKHAMPGIVGKTKARKGQDGWEDMKAAVADIAANFSAVIGDEEEITKVDFSAQGELPYPKLVDAMNRTLASIWRGADLSTISSGSGEGTGASLQGTEEHGLKCSDAKMVSETLNAEVDAKVIGWHFGEGVKPAAYARVVVPPLMNQQAELAVDAFLRDSGAPLGVKATLERYGRTTPGDGDELLTKPAPPPQPGGFGAPRETGFFAANERRAQSRLIQRTAAEFDAEAARVLEPLAQRINAVMEMPNEQLFRVSMRKLRADLPGMLQEIGANPPGSRAIERALVAGWFNGIAQGLPHE